MQGYTFEQEILVASWKFYHCVPPLVSLGCMTLFQAVEGMVCNGDMNSGMLDIHGVIMEHRRD